MIKKTTYTAPDCCEEELVFDESFLESNTETIGGKDDPDNEW